MPEAAAPGTRLQGSRQRVCSADEAAVCPASIQGLRQAEAEAKPRLLQHVSCLGTAGLAALARAVHQGQCVG